ncbi:alkaline phosphatase D family protein [Nocardia sp. CDC186]|uniref:Alkaline phosphatase D family protein n=1 Tax=Nocardia implantans TaxID=3108168 RepID=A0ABU6AQV2_9NOCA|nr:MULTISPECIES: alkaline phosphatase D family protein [unclassified Nocardia]MBF6190183.1 alkaline phosphatase D family protein [Nocardia beijingensis]MEA3532708.1 alkaline phosphatase D family protein [Nocardia sp. CDC192]MEB3509839.1 alkaline phosphatase D family protein [Nocardia sp. CDC186]
MTGSDSRPSRRTVLRASALGLVAAPALAACARDDGPALVRQRPALTHGVAVGDPRADGALIWARADRPATLLVETAATESFRDPRRFTGPLLTPDSDGTGRVRVNGLPAGTQVHYRVTLRGEDGATSEPVTGVFRTAPTAASDIRLQWSGDVAGQGYGINPELGGMKIFAAMAARDPHLFLHSGDSIYADGPLRESITLPDGRIWRNVVSEAKSAVAQTLDQFRGNYAYNLTDENYRRFNSAVAQVVQWDDHETVNNWYPGGLVAESKGYTERAMDTLATRSWQAFHEWMPLEPREAVDGRLYRKIAYGPLLDVFVLDMRTNKDANDANTGPDGRIFGPAQTKWLVDSLRESTATWKIIANDLPLGLVVADGEQKNATAFEGPANGDPGAPSGREREIARVLSSIKANKVTGVVWLTADVHYTAAHRYSPERAAFTDFDEFWEFVSGPLNAGAFGPNQLDGTFGPEAVYVHAPPVQNSSPLDAFQHFGEVRIDGRSRELTVDLCDAAGSVLFSKSLAPASR